MKELAKVMIEGTRTNLSNGKLRKVQVSFSLLKPEEHERLVVHVTDGGVTGYESFYLTPDSVFRLIDGWSACAGTEGRWDRLYFDGGEMRKLFEAFVGFSR